MSFFILVSIFMLFGTFFSKGKQDIFIAVSFILMFYILAYRGLSVGTDTLNYEMAFNNLSSGADWIRSELEFGWVFLNDAVILFDGEFRDLLVISAALTLLPIFYVAKKYSYNPMLTILFYYLFYFYFYSFNIMRQSIAISIIFLSLAAFLNNRIKTFLFFIFLASTFHYSAFIFLFIYLAKIGWEKKNIYLSLIVSLLFGILGVDIFSKIISFVGYSSYILDYEYGDVVGNLLFLLVINTILFLFLLSEKNISIYMKVFFIYVVFLNFLIRIPFSARLILYFAICQILIYPYLLRNFNTNDINLKVLTYIFVVSMAYITFFLKFGEGEIVPYLNIF